MQIKENIWVEKSRLLSSLAIVLFFFVLYVHSAPPTIFAGDSGELIVPASKWGFPHSPGYPLYTILGNVWIRLLSYGSIAWRMNIFSSFFASLSLGVLFLTLRKITGRFLPALIATLTLGFSYVFWEFAVVAEVFALNNFFALLLFYLFLCWREEVSEKLRDLPNFGKGEVEVWELFRLRRLLLCAAVLALSVTHHHLIALFFPGYLYLCLSGAMEVFRFLGGFRSGVVFIWKHKAGVFRFLAVVVVIVSLILTLYIYLFLVTRFNPAFVWRPVRSWSDFLYVFFRREYGTFKIARQVGRLWETQSRYLRVYPTFLEVNFHLVGILVSMLGFIACFFKDRDLAVSLALSFLFSGLFFAMFSSLPFKSLFFLAMLEKFAQMSLLLIPFWLTYAFSSFQERFGSKLVLLGLGLPLFLGASNFCKLDLQGLYLGRYFAEDLLRLPRENAVVYLSGDTLLFNSLYLHQVEGKRKDLKILFGSGERLANRIRELKRELPTLSIAPEDIEDSGLGWLVEHNLDKFPFYTTVPIGGTTEVQFVPVGLLYEVLPKEAEVDLEARFQIIKDFFEESEFLENYDVTAFYPAHIKAINDYYAIAALRAGEYFLSEKAYQPAQAMFLKSKIWKDFYYAHFNLGGLYLRQGQCNKARNSFSKAIEIGEGATKEVLYNLHLLYKDCYHEPAKAQEFWELYEERKGEET